MKTTYRSLISGLFAIIILSLVNVIGVNAQTTGKNESHYSNLVIFVSFSDSDGAFMQTQANPNIFGDLSDVDRIQKYYNDDSYKKSLVSFVRSISYGQLTIDSYLPQLQNGVITPIKLSKTKASYGDNSYVVQKEAIDLFNTSYRDILTQYNLDENNDGCVDNVTFIFEGEDDNRAGAFYSHKEDYNGNETLNGLRVGTVNVQNEESILYDPTLSEGVLCHEYLHSLGFPDLYKNGDTTATPVGRWDIMAGTSPFLQFPLAYMRSTEYLGVNGWLTIDTITKDSLPEDGVVTLDPASSAEGKQAYILKSPLNDSEFFVIEYRKQGEKNSEQLEVKIPGTGLIVYRINTKVERLSNHYGDTDGVYVFRENQTSVTAGDNMSLDQSFYSAECGRTSIGNLDLDATINDGALVFSDGSNSGIQISEIGSAGDTISCKIDYADTESVELWNTLGNGYVSNENTSMISSDTDSKGQVYVAHSVNDNQMQISTYTEADGWKTVGNNIAGYGMNGVLRIYNDVPYVLFSDNTSAMNMVLYEYSSARNQWIKVALVPSVTNGYVQYYSMEVGRDGLYVAYEDGDFSGYTIKLGKFSAGKWSVVQDNVAKLQGVYPDISIGADEKIYIAMRDYGKNTPIVYCYDGKSVSTVGDLSSVACGSRAKVVSGDGVLYLLADDTAGMKVFQYTSDDGWTLVGDGALTNMQSSTFDICLMDGCPIVQLVNQDAGKNNTQVFRYRAGTWQREGNTIDTAVTTEAELTVFDKKIYLSYLITSGNSEYPLVKWRELDINEDDKPVIPPVDPTDPDPSEPTDVKVTKITLNESNKTIKIRESYTLTTNILPANATDTSVTWSSSDESVAIVENGVVTTKKVGIAMITATANDGSGLATSCKIQCERYTPYSGERLIAGKWYHFDEVTGRMTVGWCVLPDGRKVYYSIDGSMVYKERCINGCWYYFHPVYGTMTVGWCTLPDGRRVYYDSEGKMVYGEQKIGSAYYYFNSITGAMQQGWQTSGKLKKYYLSSGIRATGELCIGGKWYHFDLDTGVMTIGWCQLSNKKVYYTTDGTMVYGEKKIGDYWYYFDKTYGSMTVGWYTLGDGRKVYYNAEGHMIYGEQQIQNKNYYFDNINGAMIRGWRIVNGLKYYYLSSGVRASGEAHINGKWYYFNPETGIMTIGWCTLPDRRVVYYGSDGAMIYGERYLSGYWYFFNTITGARTIYWTTLPDGRKVYYNSEGKMQYGNQMIDGKNYFFDLVTGALK